MYALKMMLLLLLRWFLSFFILYFEVTVSNRSVICIFPKSGVIPFPLPDSGTKSVWEKYCGAV